MDPSLVISYAPEVDTRQPVVLIMLEQDGWLPYTGQVTKAAMVRFLANLIYGTTESPQVDCGFDGDNINLLISAYPYFPELNYSLLASYGSLSEPSIQELEKNETVQLQLEQNVAVKYPVLSIVSAEWLNDAYNEEMEVISPPPAIIIGDDYKTVSAAIPCYGSVKVTYKTLVHSYILQLTARPDTAQNKYSSVIFAVYDGGLVYLQTEAPPGAEDTGTGCAYGNPNSGGDGDPPDDPPEDPSGTGDKETRVNYCTQKVLSVNTG